MTIAQATRPDLALPSSNLGLELRPFRGKNRAMPTSEGFDAGGREGSPSDCEELSAALTLAALATFAVDALKACCAVVDDVVPAIALARFFASEPSDHRDALGAVVASALRMAAAA